MTPPPEVKIGPEPEHPVEMASRWGVYKWLAGGAGVAALGTGAYLAHLDGSCKQTPMPGRPCNDVYSIAPIDYIMLGGGAVLAGIAVYMFATDRVPAARTAYVVPTAGGALAGFSTSW